LPVRRLAKNGFDAWADLFVNEFEGLVAKEEVSLYEAGPDAPLAEGKAAGLDARRGPLAAADQRRAVDLSPGALATQPRPCRFYGLASARDE